MGGGVPNPVKVIKKAANVATKVVDTVVVKPAEKLLKVPEKIVGTGLKVTENVLKAGADVVENVTKPVVGAVGDVVQGVVGAIIPTPKIPEMPAVDDGSAAAADDAVSRSNQMISERDRADRLRRRRGRAATQLVQPSIAAVPTGSVATKSLLGQ